MIGAKPGMAARNHSPRSVLVELGIVNALASQLFDRRLAERGLKPVQFGLLTVVATHGPITPTRLERESGLMPATLRERLRALERAGYVHKVANPRDRRSHFVEITPDGVTFLKQASVAIRAVESDISRALGAPFEDYRPLLEKLRVAEQSLLAEAPHALPEDAGTDVTFR
jgi:DNA-binding MarR family transcriptional regulator